MLLGFNSSLKKILKDRVLNANFVTPTPSWLKYPYHIIRSQHQVSKIIWIMMDFFYRITLVLRIKITKEEKENTIKVFFF